MQREFSDAEPELMDLPNLDEQAPFAVTCCISRASIAPLAAGKAVETVFHKLADKSRGGWC